MKRSLILAAMLLLAAPAATAKSHVPAGSLLVPGNTLVYQIYGGQRTMYADIYKPMDLPDYGLGHLVCDIKAATENRFKVDCEAPNITSDAPQAFWHKDSTYEWTSKGLVRHPAEGEAELSIPKSRSDQKKSELRGSLFPLMGSKTRVFCYNPPDLDEEHMGDAAEIAFCLSLKYGPVWVDATTIMGAGSFEKLELVAVYKTAELGSAMKAHKLIKKAQKFFIGWLEAQNHGKFKVYKELYSKDYKGIKRAGSKTRIFRKDSWMKDRAKMFKGRMKVQARDVSYTVTPDRIYIAFRQTWESKRWKDTGPKQLVLTHGPRGMKIVSEEMIESFRMK